MLDLHLLKTLFDQQKKEIFEDYFTFLRFKSIATDPEFKEEVNACADWLQTYLQNFGLNVEKWETGNAPVIFAQDLRAGPKKETLLLYCHYDVQPVDPLDEWLSPPFEPTMRDGTVYARGAVDNKGQCFYTIAAIRTVLKQLGSLPVNLKFVIEGEEESGSEGLSQLLYRKKEQLKADHLLIVDSGTEAPDTPAISLGARGLVCFNLKLTESLFDMHSGVVGGIARNPNRALCQLLSKLHDSTGRVTIPGFYDDVVEMPPNERNELDFSFDPTNFHSIYGFEPTGMEEGISAKEACWLRPTLEINGIGGGYSGPGFKTVIPKEANAKISCRLVPRQDPGTITRLVHDYLMNHKPRGLKLEIEAMAGGGRAFRTSASSKIANILAKSYSEVFGKTCKKILIGGSIPIGAELAKVSEADLLLVGVGLPTDRIHAPNEHFSLDRFEKGFLTICRALALFA